MSAFKFRLEKVLKIRELQEDLAKQEWAVQERLAQEERKKLADLLVCKEEVKHFGYTQTGLELRQAMYGYLEVLEYRIKRQSEVVAEQEKRVEEAKNNWFSARQETKKVSILREKQYAQFVVETQRKEQKFLDDIRSYLEE